MRSTLFRIPLPDFLKGFGFPDSLPVFSYGLMILLSYVVVVYLAQLRASKFNLEKKYISDIAIWTLFGGILGARVMHLILYSSRYQSFIDFFKIYEGGLVFYGSLMTSPLIFLWAIRKYKIKLNDALTIFVPVMPLGVGIGRLGCFMNGCCYGKPGEMSWCVTFPEGSFPYGDAAAIPLHPSQLYAFFLGLGLSILLYILDKKMGPQHGVKLFFVALFGYGVIRLIEEHFRMDTPNSFAGILTAGQGTSLIIMFISVVFLITSRLRAVR